MEHEDYLKRITQYIKVKDDAMLEEFKSITHYVSGQYDQDESFQGLEKFISESETKRGVEENKRNRVYYMALPPSVFVPVAKGLKRNVYSKNAINRLVVEKPFGHDSESSNELGRELGALFKENEVSMS
jgi:glucose-6-phosphate 1-dehydrogenase